MAFSIRDSVMNFVDKWRHVSLKQVLTARHASILVSRSVNVAPYYYNQCNYCNNHAASNISINVPLKKHRLEPFSIGQLLEIKKRKLVFFNFKITINTIQHIHIQ